MTGFNHALTGAAIGLAVQQPLLVVPLAFASHFLLDALPHFEHPFYKFGHKHAIKFYIADATIAVIGISLVMFLVPQLILPVLLGAVFAVLPDATLLHYYKHNRPKHWFHNFHVGIQWFERPIGIFVEFAYLGFISTMLWALPQY